MPEDMVIGAPFIVVQFVIIIMMTMKKETTTIVMTFVFQHLEDSSSIGIC